jgi:hypothetical protein
MNKPILKGNYVLALCDTCGTANYVESHGIDAVCSKCKVSRNHHPIPYNCRDFSGLHMIRRAPKNHVSATN